MDYREVTARVEPGRLLLFISKLCSQDAQLYDADQHKGICKHIAVCNHCITSSLLSRRRKKRPLQNRRSRPVLSVWISSVPSLSGS